ncbi:recombinase family protein [Mycolicibacterium iranicum]|uniref:Recombinase family protein n=1 Tax=Mycolicibacterium iranicum TaxID=912594 RepID=A0ABT4HJV0_MYCIR|nr:recombinase family protein [Mycolicibacterium iranicum]MCZ0730471.1 recombinase family protein [Mycolicibacterium iranicum]
MTTAIYLRQSIDRNGDELAVSRQREDLERLCAVRGWASPAMYVDNDFSASVRMPGSRKMSKPRPAFTQLMADVRAGRIDAIAVWDADRLYRHPRELEDIIDLADRKGLALATVGGDFDLATPTGRGNARMKGVFARMEMEQKADRQKRAALQRATDTGKPWWPSRPFGYDADPDPITGKWTCRGEIRLHPTESKLVADAYRAVERGSSLHSIAQDWNASGVTTPKGSVWRGAQVRQLLLCARNAGLREYRGEIVRDDSGNAMTAPWPAIVTEEQWHSVSGILGDPKRRSGPTRGRKHLLSGIAVCAVCEHTLGSGITSNTQKTNYLCKEPDCHGVSRNAEKLDAVVIETVVERLSRDDAVELLEPEADAPDLDTAREEAKVLRKRQQALGLQHATGKLSLNAFSAADQAITEQLALLDRLLKAPAQVRIFDGVIGAEDVGDAFDGLDLDRQRAIVDALVTVTVRPTGRGRVFRREDVAVDFKRPPRG